MVGVLIVDDEKLTREGLATRIPWEQNGFIVCGTAESGYEALDQIERSIPDIVILDIRMPEMDGIELLSIIRHTYPSIRTILISGYDEFSYAQQAIESRAFSYILKPIDDELLLRNALRARDEIVAEKRRLKEDAALRARYHAWLPTVRNNLLCRIARGAVSPGGPEMEEAAELGVDLTGDWFRIILFQTQETSVDNSPLPRERGYREYAVLDRAIEMWDLPAKVHGFDCGSIAGLLVTDLVKTEQVREVMSRLRGWANQMAGLSVTIGVGREVRGLSSLPESLASARRALAARIVAGRNTVIVADSSMPSRTAHTATLELQSVLDALEATAAHAVQSGASDAPGDLAASISSEVRRLVEGCIEAKGRLLHQVIAFLMKIRFALDLDLPTTGVFECAEVESIDELEEHLRRFFRDTSEQWHEKQNAHNNHLVKRAIEHLHRNANNDISLTRVADAMGVHPNYLSSVFRSVVGRRFIDYEREVKIEEAKRLLRETPLRVYEVAASVHYQDVNHFTRIFKKQVGCSPTEFRNL